MSKDIFVIIIALAVIVCGPIITIWALNTLFPALAIPTTFDTWLAAFLLQGVLVYKKSN